MPPNIAIGMCSGGCTTFNINSWPFALPELFGRHWNVLAGRMRRVASVSVDSPSHTHGEAFPCLFVCCGSCGYRPMCPMLSALAGVWTWLYLHTPSLPSLLTLRRSTNVCWSKVKALWPGVNLCGLSKLTVF